MNDPVENAGTTLWQRLRSRRIVQWGLGYVAVAWGLLQATGFAVETFHWPEVVTRTAVIAAVAGLPIALTIAWFHGKRGEQRVRRLELAILAVLSAAGLFAVYRELTEVQPPAATAQAGVNSKAAADSAAATVPARSVAVLPFVSVGNAPDGPVLAFGIAEAVLHQLANLRELEVTARTSSFSLQEKPGDARAVGRVLNVRYLLEGSVQEAGERLRVTAQLIDTVSGVHVWSIRFDKDRADIFAVQDEIAAQVANALKLSLDADTADRLAGQGTTNVNAYLAYLDGRSRLAQGSVGEAENAIKQFTQALQLDPSFAAALVSLAEAEIFAAEFNVTDDRPERFEAAVLRASDLVDSALAIDPKFGPAYIMRGYLEAFTDLAAAEADYRRGLELRPSDAKGYAGLAAVLWEQPAKRKESLEMLEHARRLDPREPAHDVAKAVFLSYDRGDSKGAEALLRNVLQRKPDYLPAIVRMAEFNRIPAGNYSEAIKYFEQALRLDPMSQWSRRLLATSYLDVGDERAAEGLIKSSPVRTSILELPLPIYRKQWQRAGELAYLALDDRLVSPADEQVMTIAVRRHARATGDYPRAIEALQTFAGITWTDDGVPRVPHRQGLMSAAVGVADLLLAAGETERGQRLLRAIIEQITADLRSGAKSETWLSDDLAIAQLLAGDRQRALDTLEHAFEAGIFRHSAWHFEDADPAFDVVRTDARFVALSRKLRLHMEQERAEVEKMRAAGELPRR
ncbi:MAG: hypothetical protein OEW50_06945 [Gammaproteobacteria bacterium]|nr:hypothetical protein [Gammaproteobacteria bacterium]MDH5227128.1 hypothetical protein [Gammaproteobacteria bacterium]